MSRYTLQWHHILNRTKGLIYLFYFKYQHIFIIGMVSRGYALDFVKLRAESGPSPGKDSPLHGGSDLSPRCDRQASVSTTPLCGHSQSALLAEGVKSCNFCPHCEILGALCAVAVHHDTEYRSPRSGKRVHSSVGDTGGILIFFCSE